jgi:NAD-dependent deacetylase
VTPLRAIDSAVREAAEILAAARSALFITGAGMSADSGLPTYRGIGGLYNRGVTDEGIEIEEALSGHMMLTDPALCWKYIAEIAAAGSGARPNQGHEMIARLERRLERVWVLTQNVDGLHRVAGSSQIIDIHGDVRDLICTRCDWERVVESFADLEMPPKCPACGGLVRPEVVLFGEMLQPAKTAALYAELSRGFDAVFSIGTTSVFPYIAAPVLEAASRGVPTVEINPSDTVVSDRVRVKIAGGAAATLAAIESQL